MSNQNSLTKIVREALQFLFSPNNVVSYGEGEGPGFNQGGRMNWCASPCALRLRRLAQNAVPEKRSGIFLVNVHKIVLVTCPCALRLRRLAHNAVPGKGVRHVSCAFRLRRLVISYVCSYMRALL